MERFAAQPPSDDMAILAMRVPAHAAISTTVELVRARVGQGPAGLTNAVLRRIGARSIEDWVTALAPEDPGDAAALAHSHPRWIVEGLRAALGERVAELEALLAADNERPAVTLVARPGLSEAADLPGEPGRWSPYAVTLPSGDPAQIAAVRQGRAGVQDEGSQLVALALAEALTQGRDERWLDACAGPGGKAALLAALAAQRGARLVAGERQPHRAELVKRAVRLLPETVVVAADATTPPWPEGAFDRILLDAPCTGLGALRRRPEARWRRTPAEVAPLVALQHALLRQALRDVRVGGLVAYATCSPLLAETEAIVREALARGGCEVVPVTLAVPDADGPVPGSMQLWPHRHGTDAMFVCLLRRLA